MLIPDDKLVRQETSLERGHEGMRSLAESAVHRYCAGFSVLTGMPSVGHGKENGFRSRSRGELKVPLMIRKEYRTCLS